MLNRIACFDTVKHSHNYGISAKLAVFIIGAVFDNKILFLGADIGHLHIKISISRAGESGLIKLDILNLAVIDAVGVIILKHEFNIRNPYGGCGYLNLCGLRVSIGARSL